MAYSFYFPTKFIFADNAVDSLLGELNTIPAGAIFVITDEGIIKAGVARSIFEGLDKVPNKHSVFSDVPGNPEVKDVDKAVKAAQTTGDIAAIVAVGGGSVIDTAKAVSVLLRHPGIGWEDLQWGKAQIKNSGVPVIAIPTTAGTGSEMTHVAVIGDSQGFKKGVVHSALFSHAAILDGQLTVSLPAHLTAATGMDALVHAIEAFTGKRANPVTDFYALAAIRDVVKYLPEAVAHGDNLEARKRMAQAAAWAGIAMDQAGLGLAHALAGPLCAHYHLHHGLGVAVLLPQTLAYNAEEISGQRWEALRDAMGVPEKSQRSAMAAAWASSFLASIGLPVKLKDLGVESSMLDTMANEATRMAMIGNNVRAADQGSCKLVLESAL